MNYYVCFEILISFGLDSNTIYSGCKRFRQGKTKSWENKKDPNDKRKVLINLDTIPDGTRKKYNIPTGAEYQAQQREAKRQEVIAFMTQIERERIEKEVDQQLAEEREKEILENSAKLALRDAYNNHWLKYYSLYKERYSSRKDCDKLAQQSAREHAFWLKMVEVTGGIWRGEFGKAGICFEYLQDLKKELVFTQTINNATYFRRKLKDLRDKLKLGKSIVDVIANNKIGERAPESKKYNDFHKGSILYFVGHEKKYSYRLCTRLINQHCADEKQRPLNESYIKKVLQTDNEFRTLVFSLRNGAKYLKENILPHASRHPVEFPANLWMIDGTPVQFYCRNDKGTIVRMSVFVVLDAFSRKVVGYDIAMNEDKFMVMNALKMAVREEGHLPKEILSDNFSANKTPEIIALKEFMAKLDVNWRLAKVGNPQDKSQVERFFGVFQSEECVSYDDYIGEGIASKRDNRPTPEFLEKSIKKILSVNQMKDRIITMIVKYNAREKRTRLSPLELYKLPKPKAVELDGFKTALMFWNRTKHTIKQGMVKITVNKVEHSFEIYDHKQKLQLQGKTVYVRYDTDNLDSVMLFDIDNEKALCECKKTHKFHIATDDRTDECNENILIHTAKKKSYKKHIDKQIENIKDKMLDVIGKDKIDLIHPLDADKHIFNDTETQNTLENHRNHFNIKVGQEDPEHRVLRTLEHSRVKAKDYEDFTVNKKSLGKASLKVVKPTDN